MNIGKLKFKRPSSTVQISGNKRKSDDDIDAIREKILMRKKIQEEVEKQAQEKRRSIYNTNQNDSYWSKLAGNLPMICCNGGMSSSQITFSPRVNQPSPEEIARQESDLDVATVLGIGFPDFRGGVIKYARDRGLS